MRKETSVKESCTTPRLPKTKAPANAKNQNMQKTSSRQIVQEWMIIIQHDSQGS